MKNPITGVSNADMPELDGMPDFAALAKDVRVWIAGALVIAFIVGIAVVGTMTQPKTEARQSSAYVLGKDDAKEIKTLVKNAVIDCGTWGLNTSLVNKDNADGFKDMAYRYAMGTDRPTGNDVQKAISRQDARKTCLYNYFSDLSPYQNATPEPSQYDAMMSYGIVSNDVSVSNPKDSRLAINNNSRSSLTVKVSWTSMESGFYQPTTATTVQKPGGGADVSVQPSGVWSDLSKEHRFRNMAFSVEKTDDGKWRIVEVDGEGWKTDGYVMDFSPYTANELGAKRLTPPDAPAPADVKADKDPTADDKYDGSQNAGDDCIDEATGEYKCPLTEN